MDNLIIMLFIVFLISLSLGIIYYVLKYLYGKKPSEWKPIVFTKGLTFRNIFQSRKSKEINKK